MKKFIAKTILAFFITLIIFSTLTWQIIRIEITDPDAVFVSDTQVIVIMLIVFIVINAFLGLKRWHYSNKTVQELPDRNVGDDKSAWF